MGIFGISVYYYRVSRNVQIYLNANRFGMSVLESAFIPNFPYAIIKSTGFSYILEYLSVQRN